MPKSDNLNTNLFLDTLKQHILEWRDFFQSIKKQEVTEGFIKGLYGELCFIIDLIEKNEINSFDEWRGPSGARSDFVFEKSRFEVKATTTRNPVKIAISNDIQLEPSKNHPLYLVIIELLGEENGESIKDLIKLTLNLIKGTHLNEVDFYKKLELIGCSQDVIEQMNEFKYKVYSKNLYTVNDNFPSILKSQLRNGVIDVKYSILKDCLSDFNLDYSKISSII